MIIALHDKRSLAERVDFITTPGYLDGPGAREKWGLPPDTGPEVIVTNKAVMHFDNETKEAYLSSWHPGTSIDEVVSLTPWKLKVSDDVHETEPPTAEELRVLREVLDRSYGGRDILNEMKRKNISIPTVVVTQFNVFSEGKSQMDQLQLDNLLREEHQNIYKGMVYYNAQNLDWKANLDFIINKNNLILRVEK